jgi:hypothetical protein
VARVDESARMKHPSLASHDPFPCPFCKSPDVRLIGEGPVFVHYRCGGCAETWTAMSFPVRRMKRRAHLHEEPAQKPYLFH